MKETQEMTVITFPRFYFDGNEYFGFVASKSDMRRLFKQYAGTRTPEEILSRSRENVYNDGRVPSFGMRIEHDGAMTLGRFLEEFGFTLDGILDDGTEPEAYDSWKDTMDHKERVAYLLHQASEELNRRGKVHDDSKLESPEKEAFDRETPKLKSIPYGTAEYNESLDGLQDALRHHYAHNSHHPQHYMDGVNGMDLFDLLEMYMDWIAAGERTKDGSIEQSILFNRSRFEMSDQLVSIFMNTASRYKL